MQRLGSVTTMYGNHISFKSSIRRGYIDFFQDKYLFCEKKHKNG